MYLYLTADQVGIQTGGGVVTFNEAEAMKTLGPCEVWGREQLEKHDKGVRNEPWHWDIWAYHAARYRWGIGAKRRHKIEDTPNLAHFYAGTFSQFVEALKFSGVKVTYTAAAHDVQKSRQAHEALGVKYDYPHITDPALWKRYVQGYLEADILICPSTHSANVMRGFGATNRIEVIPHGCNLPLCTACGGTGGTSLEILSGLHAEDDTDECGICEGTGLAPIAPLPSQFRLGYLGAYGPDKGVVTLLKAWRKLDYSDAVLVLGGRDSNSAWTHALLQHCDYPRNVVLTGWVDNVSTFYDSISCYVQPSITEGFGCEVLEAMGHGRPVICSTGAGAVDLLEFGMTFPAGDVNELAGQINLCYTNWKLGGSAFVQTGEANRFLAERYTWDKVRDRYLQLWREML